MSFYFLLVLVTSNAHTSQAVFEFVLNSFRRNPGKCCFNLASWLQKMVNYDEDFVPRDEDKHSEKTLTTRNCRKYSLASRMVMHHAPRLSRFFLLDMTWRSLD